MSPYGKRSKGFAKTLIYQHFAGFLTARIITQKTAFARPLKMQTLAAIPKGCPPEEDDVGVMDMTFSFSKM